MTLGIITLGLVIGTWVMAVTTERGQQITAWIAHFLGIFSLITIMIASMLFSLNLVTRAIGV